MVSVWGNKSTKAEACRSDDGKQSNLYSLTDKKVRHPEGMVHK